jgi:hypothetical protein
VFCPECGAQVPPGKNFCSGCGAKITAPAPAPPTLKKQRRTPPPPPPSGATLQFAIAIPRSGISTGPLPFQEQTTQWAAQINTKLGASGAGMLGRWVRAVLMDKTIYGEVSGNPGLQSEAWLTLGISVLLGLIGSIPLTSMLNAVGNPATIGSFVIQGLMALGKVWVVRWALTSWNRNVPFDTLFRALAYAHAPLILRLLPAVGDLTSVWMLATTTIAVKDVARIDLVNAIVVALGAVMGSAIVSYLLGMAMRVL